MSAVAGHGGSKQCLLLAIHLRRQRLKQAISRGVGKLVPRGDLLDQLNGAVKLLFADEVADDALRRALACVGLSLCEPFFHIALRERQQRAEDVRLQAALGFIVILNREGSGERVLQQRSGFLRFAGGICAGNLQQSVAAHGRFQRAGLALCRFQRLVSQLLVGSELRRLGSGLLRIDGLLCALALRRGICFGRCVAADRAGFIGQFLSTGVLDGHVLGQRLLGDQERDRGETELQAAWHICSPFQRLRLFDSGWKANVSRERRWNARE
ncbi:MAG TPA: hypothetical protein VHN74_05175 [Candidatus Angelobacter sp.]|nr:hypothetical protein [Candidatus Angelobacter sp.]